ncbi:PKD domain-containing protein [Flammeovirga kamogawensis]|uniref:PKD domain-containing protein n=1 Tax=Flammeovirga kamogawensis TaxID=373891 RepID=A0ABX8H2I3_9BACT|nr:PKD domain-containing protein [Flammeovirga kamogawensis]MBB6460310.1 gliding motility-associated-like protein [Flammeovirga kamogawensis]QWG10119.1 PKD domain-containing protein [Flammeovirga kamogawensis]
MKFKIFKLLCIISLLAYSVAAQEIMVKNNNDNSISNLTLLTKIDGCTSFSGDFWLNGAKVKRWEYGKSVSILKKPSLIFSTKGENKLKAYYDVNGVEDSVSVVIEIIKLPTSLAFSSSVKKACFGSSITFKAENINYKYREIYFIVDGVKVKNGGSYTFKKSQYYDVIMKVITPSGCETSIKKDNYIQIFDKIDFSVSPNKVVVPGSSVTKTFQIFTSVPNLKFTWDFGDGTPIATGNSVTHTFKSKTAIVYKVKVTASNTLCTKTEVVDVAINSKSNIFDIKVTNDFCTSEVFEFIPNLPSKFNGKDIIWEFSDGYKVTKTLPLTVKRRFPQGTKNITITATVDGIIDQKELPSLLPKKQIKIKSDKLFCSLPYNVSPTIIGRNKLPKGYSFKWITSDGAISTSATPTFTFKKNTTKTIVLYGVNKSLGIECEIDRITVVGDKYEAKILSTNDLLSGNIYKQIEGCQGFSTELYYSIKQFKKVVPSAAVKNVIWNITKDGKPFLYKNNHRIKLNNLRSGKYEIKLTIRTKLGCVTILKKNILIGTELTPSFKVKKSTICNFEVLELVNTSNFAANINMNDVQYQTNLGKGWEDGFISNHMFRNTASGIIDIKLRVVYKGCPGMAVKKQITIQAPMSSFKLVKISPCDINSLEITNLSKGADNYIWEIIENGTVIMNHTTTSKAPFKLTDLLGRNLTEGVIYTIILTTTTSANTCTDVYDEEYKAIPYSNLTINSNDIIFVGESANFSLTSTLPLVTNNIDYEWTFEKDGKPYSIGSIKDKQPTVTFTEIGEYTVKVKVKFHDGGLCEKTFIKKGIQVIEIDASEINGIDKICLNNTGGTSTQNFSITPILKIKDHTKLNFFESKWEVWGDGPTPLFTSKVNTDSKNITNSFSYQFTSPRLQQFDEYEIRFTMVVGLRQVQKSKYVKVTAPVLNFGPLANHVSYNYECQEVITTIDPKLDYSKISDAQKATYLIELIDQKTRKKTILNDVLVVPISKDNVHLVVTRGLQPGQNELSITVTDPESCAINEQITITVPPLPIFEADFTPSTFSLPCRGFIDLIDLANETNGNSISRKDINGNKIPISRWFYHIVSTSGVDDYVESLDGKYKYFFESGTYEVSLVAEDQMGCRTTSPIKKIKVGGVRGEINNISKKIGYAPFKSEVEAILTYKEKNTNGIVYSWFSGDGVNSLTSAMKQTMSYTKLPVTSSSVTPGLYFIDKNGCKYAITAQDDITILQAPTIVLNDIQKCTADGSINVNASPKNFTPANVDNSKYSYNAKVHYQWYVNNTLIDAADGGDKEQITIIYGKDKKPFTVDPDDVNGKTFVLEYRMEADYHDKQNRNNSHHEKSPIKSTSFTVKYDPQPIAKIKDIHTVCENETLYLDASESSFGDFSRGKIERYEWEIKNWGTKTSTNPQLIIPNITPGIYEIKLTVYTLNLCAKDSTTKTVTVGTLPIVDFSADIACFGDVNVFNNLSTFKGKSIEANPSSIDYVKWYFDYNDKKNEVISTEISPEYIFLKPGIHKVKLEVYSKHGCMSSVTKDIEIVSRNLNTFISMDTTFCFKTDGKIELQAPQNKGLLYYWKDTNETTSKVLRDKEGTYELLIIDTSTKIDCKTYYKFNVRSLCSPQIFTPTGMSPNNDGLNDEFLIRSRYALDIKLNIYNRWGEIIFSKTYKNSSEARQEGNGWDGNYKGKVVAEGVYTYTIVYTSELDGSSYRMSNTISVLP